MRTTLTITRQWQIYIPQEMRKLLNLEHTDQFVATVQGKKLILKPQKSPIMEMAGKYADVHRRISKEKKIDIDHIRDYIDYAEEYTP